MAFTVASLEAMILAGCKPQIVAALSDYTTNPPTPPDNTAISAFLSWAVVDGVLDCNGTVVDYSNPADADLVTVSDGRLRLTAMLAAKRRIVGSLAFVDLQQGTDSMKLSQLAAAIEKEVADLQAKLVAQYGASPTSAPRILQMTSAPDPGAGGLQPLRLLPPPQESFP